MSGPITSLANGFYQSSQRYPGRPALQVQGREYSYASLAGMASLLKDRLGTIEAGESRLVGLFAYRSRTAFAGILAIHGAGGGYVPLHPDYPVARTLGIIESSGIRRIIVGPECWLLLSGMLEQIKRPLTIVAADLADQEIGRVPMRHKIIRITDLGSADAGPYVPVSVNQDDLAYLLFTSGSTGRPKGVPVSHGNVLAYVKFFTGRYDLNENDRCSQMHDLTFDFSVQDIYPTWAVGACLCVADKNEKLLPVSYIHKSRITSWASVPSVATLIDRYGRLDPGVFPGLRFSFFCGEALYATTAAKWQAAAPNAQVVNLYGPTETTMAITYFDWNSTASVKCLNGIVPIGRIFDDQTYYLVDENRCVVRTGEAGDLCLAGTQVSRGYWDNPEQTASHYITFADQPGVTWFRTGDLVREGPDGCLFYLGRVDHQVKVLGNRVELGEIDQVLRDASGSDMAVALPWPVKDGNADGIMAFIGGQGAEGSILEACRQKLPKYMVPSRVQFVAQMPLNVNGKIDRSALRRILEQKASV